MNWKHRSGGDWSVPTVKIKRAGQWIALSSAQPGNPTYEFGWRDPPTRSSTVLHSDIGGSIQDAFDTLSSDTEFVLDDGPYEETATLPSTDQITITGESSGTTWNAPGSVHRVLDTPSWSLETTTCDAIDEGESTLSVDNTSDIESGDDLEILDSSDLYHDIGSDDLNDNHTQYKGEFAIVESVDTDNDTITIEGEVHQEYTNPNGDLQVSAIDWGLTDVHITNIDFYGDVSRDQLDPYGPQPAKPMHLSQLKDVWITDCTADGWHQDLVTIAQGRNSYIEDCHVHDIGRYGISHTDGWTHSRVQDCAGGYIDPDESGYLVQAGGGSTDEPDRPAPTYDIQARNCTCETSDFLYEAHFAAENVRYYDGDIDSGDSRVCKMRGVDQHLIGGTYSPTTGWAFQSSQVARECSIEEAYVSDANHGWVLWPREDQWFGDLLMRDVQWEDMDGSPIYFRETDDGQAPDIRGIEIVNSSWNGEWIDDAAIESSNGFDSSRIDYSTEYPDDQTPAEYFD